MILRKESSRSCSDVNDKSSDRSLSEFVDIFLTVSANDFGDESVMT